jgi:hypothetical protein
MSDTRARVSVHEVTLNVHHLHRKPFEYGLEDADLLAGPEIGVKTSRVRPPSRAIPTTSNELASYEPGITRRLSWSGEAAASMRGGLY